MGSRGRRGPLFGVLAVVLFLSVASPASATLVYETQWGSTGTDPGQFQTPEGVAVGAGGVVYVADSLNDRIQKFDADGVFLTTWGLYGTAGNGRFSRPSGVATDFAGNVYVADTGNHRIQKFDSNGVFLTKFGSFGNGNGQFNGPYGVATDATGNVYVADTGNNRIQKFDSSGSFLFKWGTPGSGTSQFNSPTDVAVDGSDVYVTDSFNYRIQKFDSSGAFLTAWGSQGNAPGQFDVPYGIAADPTVGVVVSDSNNHRVQRFSSSGDFLSSAGSFGSGPGEFRFPTGVGAASGSVYVADSGNDRIERFAASAVIRVQKDAVPDDPQDFDFTTGGGLSPSTFQLDDDGNPSNALSNSRVFPVDPGSGYSVSETVPAGWDLASATCSDGSPPSNIDVSVSEEVTCTFTNNKRAQIVVVQDTLPDDPQDFDYTAGGGLTPTSFQLDDDGDNSNALSNTRTFDNVSPGSGYSISQTTPGGWTAADVTCSDGSSPSNIDVSPGEVVTCTFANVTPTSGLVKVVKDAQPNDPQDFSFSAAGGLSPSSFQLDDDGDNSNALSNQRTFVVGPGSGYSVSETVPSGWLLSSATCSDGSPVSNIDVSSGEVVTCTFTNQRPATVVVVKDAQPNNAQDFDFTAGGGLSPSSFQLDDDGNATLSNTRTFSNVAPGTGYSLSEAVPEGWEQVSATCSDGSPVSNIDAGPAETITCTFTNRRLGIIQVVKNAQPDDPQDFSFTAGGGLSPSSFLLDDDGDNSNGLFNSRSFLGLQPGNYSIAETVPAGWNQLSATCNDGSSPSNISLSTGEFVQCVFTNQKRGTITVVQDTSPDGPQDFSYTAPGLTPNSFQLDDDGDNSNALSNTRTYSNLNSGTYAISQTTVPGWLLEQATCSDGSSPSSINLGIGEDVTCTFVNSQRSKIVVRKDAQPDHFQDFSFTTGGGFSQSSFQLDDDGNEANPLPSSLTFIVDPGSGYSVSEDPPPAPWTLDSATCSDGSPVSNIDASQGETVTCTFVNKAQGLITYPRPKGATPLRASLVPAYKPCTAPNRTHGPPLAFPSCNPPVQQSSAITIGTPDANGSAANAVGIVRFDVNWFPGGVDDTDVQIGGSVIDVRCLAGTVSCGNANAADGSDYTGRLRARTLLRITDPLSIESATVQDIPLEVTLSCANTASTAIGGQCDVNTTVDTLIPGAVPEGRRSIWAMDQVQLFDGGNDGDVTTIPNTLFMVQGTFTP